MNKVIAFIFSMIACLVNSVDAGNLSTVSIITGKVYDANESLPGASIFIIQDTITQTVAAHTVADDCGNFSLSAEAGEYLLGITCVGYETYKGEITLKQGENCDLGKIVLAPSANDLQTVIVQGKPVRVSLRPDGFVVNVGGINKTSNNVLDLLRRLPNINVKGNNVKVIGKESVSVKVNNVLLRVSEEQLGEVLSGYDAALVQSVEVITQPSLKDDPDGNTAVIVLHMSSYFKEYMGGVVGVELMKGENHNGRYGGYGSLIFNRNKLFVSLTPAYNHNSSYMKEDIEYKYSDNSLYKVVSPSAGDNDYWGISLTAQYQYNKNGYAGISGGFNKRKTDNDFDFYESLKDGEDILLNYHNVNGYNSDKPKGQVTAYLEHTYGNNNKVWFETSYYNFTTDSNTDFYSYLEQEEDVQLQYNNDDYLNVEGFGISNDYSFNLNKNNSYKVDFGYKVLSSKTRHTRDYEQYSLNSASDTYTQRDGIYLNETSCIPYLGATFRFSERYWLRGGLQSHVTYRSLEQTEVPKNKKNYVSWLPSLHFAFTPNQFHKVTLTLNTSIKQPKFDQLNPFEWRVSQHGYNIGNVDLSPEMNYIYRLSYVFKGMLSFSGIIKQGKDLIVPVSYSEGDNIYTKTENAQDSEFYGAECGYYFDRLRWLNFSVDGFVGKGIYTGHLPELSDKKDTFKWGMSSSLNFIFNKSRTFTGYISGYYEGRNVTTVSTVLPTYNVEAGLMYFMLNRKLAFSLAGIDLLSSRYKGYSNRNGYRIDFNNKYSYPTIYFSVSYKFHNSTDKSPRKRMSSRDIESRL